jgi:serine/threonine protein kinase/tetratricopeptide (TPR) repeat protein
LSGPIEPSIVEPSTTKTSKTEPSITKHNIIETSDTESANKETVASKKTEFTQGKKFQHYKIIKLLNQGGMGKIYLAQDTRLHRDVVIKTLHTEQPLLDNNVPLNNALNEARLLAKLNHPNIVQLYDIIEHPPSVSLVMEYLEGKTLQRYQREHITTLAQKLSIITQLSAGLAAAHSQEIIHCDLKPANIIIDHNGHVKIVDFGIAKITSSNHHSDHKTNNKSENINSPVHTNSSSDSFGSQTAMSPEQLNCSLSSHKPPDDIAISFRSDLFSLGIIAFQLVSDQHPFGKGSPSQIAQNIMHSRVLDANDIVPKLPIEFISVINQLLSHDPQQRPQSSHWVHQCFEQITKELMQQQVLAQDTQPLSAHTLTKTPLKVTNVKPTMAVKRKFPRRFSLLATATSLVILLLTAAFLWQKNVTPPPHKIRHVVVLPPKIINQQPSTGSNMNMQTELVTATISDALQQGIINTQGLRLLPRSETSTFKLIHDNNIAILGAVTGATDIITTQLDCNNVRCNVTLSQLIKSQRNVVKGVENDDNVKQWHIAHQQKWPTPLENFADIYQETQRRLAKLYPKVKMKFLPKQQLEPQDYLTYVELYNQIQILGQSNNDNLKKLQILIEKSPYNYSAYTLFRETALNLYNEKQDLKYIHQLQQLMQAAPPEYRYSLFQAIDAFYLAIATNEFTHAKKQLNIAKQRGIDSSTHTELTAWLFLYKDDFTQASKYYQLALKLRPSIKLLYNLALSYYSIGDMENAKSTLQQLLTIVPSKYNARQLLADIYLLEGELELAIKAYKEVVASDAQSSDLNNLSLAFSLMGQYQNALIMAQKAFDLSKKDLTTLINLADAKMLVGLDIEAAQLYRDIVSRGKESTDLNIELIVAQAYVHLGQHSAALKVLNHAKKIAPDNGEVAFIAALIYSQVNENISAINQVEEALNQDVGAVWFNLPWFDSLCGYEQFQQLMKKAGNTKRCPL